MESSPKPPRGTIESLEARLAPSEFFESCTLVSQGMEIGDVRNIRLDEHESTLVTSICKVLSNESMNGDPQQREAALRAVKFAKFTWQLFVDKEAKVFAPKKKDLVATQSFATSLYDQRETFKGHHQSVADLVKSMSVELDVSGDYGAFVEEVACMAFAALHKTAQLQDFYSVIDFDLEIDAD